MTAFAGRIQWLKPHKRAVLFLDFLMTVVTFNILMGAFQFEFGVTIMFEFIRKPASGGMTSFASGNPLISPGLCYFRELTPMYIIMA